MIQKYNLKVNNEMMENAHEYFVELSSGVYLLEKSRHFQSGEVADSAYVVSALKSSKVAVERIDGLIISNF